MKYIILAVFLMVFSNTFSQSKKDTGVYQRFEDPSVNYQKTAKCIQQAAMSYMVGSGIAVGGSVLMALSKNDLQLSVGGGMCLAGLIVNFIGHSKLLKASEHMRYDRKLIIEPASSGVGMALKF